MKLKDLRKAKHLTQKELSMLCYASLGKICEYEQGKSLPRLDTAAKLATALDCTLDELAGFTKYAG